MAIPGATQALIAAFAFGIVVNAASAALFLYVKGHGSTIFRDGLRLVLITFLLSSALWAQIDFITTIIDTTATKSCQVGIIFSTFFDQLGRFSIEQYLLWAMNNGQHVSAGYLIPQLLALARFVVGCVFVGLSRPEVETVCVARSSLLPLAIAVIVLDFVIILAITGRALSTGIFRETRKGKSDSARSKSILLVLLGFTIWTSTSVPMLLGMNSIALIFKSSIPATGLTILIMIITACTGTLVSPRARPSTPPEAPSPREINTSRSISTTESSDYPPIRFEDLKGTDRVMSATAFMEPREAPRAGTELGGAPRAGRDGQLPRIARPITGVAGMGGVPLEGELFPPMRPITRPTTTWNPMVDPNWNPMVADPTPETAPTPKPRNKLQSKGKKSLFEFGKGGPASNITVGRLAISNPVLQEDLNPLNKIATVDLQEAARADRERRLEALQRESTLIAKRPAPPPPNMSAEDALRRAVSIKRKEVASLSPRGSRSQSSVAMQNLIPIVAGNASSTSAQLSPGGEEVRRRSPRQMPEPYQENALPARPKTPPRPKAPTPPPPPQVALKTPGLSQEQKNQQISQPRAMLSIRPSRQLPPSPKTPPEPAKTPLQRRPTTGLPSNPRSQALKTLDKEAEALRQQTVLFVNNIVYNDPTAVQQIIDGASERASKNPLPESPGTSRSVVHRPRPIPRKNESSEERAIFPSEPSPRHRRSQSGGSIISRKSILKSDPGSPTQLPPLPPPPKSAGYPVTRPQPNDTKSMTFNEKMSLLFPQPPINSRVNGQQAVPELPPLPSAYLEINSNPSVASRNSKRSDRTTKTSVRTETVFGVDEMVQESRDNAPRSLADELGQSWLPGISREENGRTPASTDAGKRASSPIIPARDSNWTESSDARTQDDVTTNWGSVHSPDEAVNMQVTRQIAKATYIQKNVDSRDAGRRTKNISGRSDIGGEVITFMLDPSSGYQQSPGGSFLMDDENMLVPERASQQGGWHRRVGEDCPTFSDTTKKRLKKMLPPTPLLLNAGLNSKNAIIVRPAEPSPLESPEQALQMIQAQLNKFEQPNGGSADDQGQRIALLENLEMEMGMQENRWHEMQHDLGRDSVSTVRTSPNRTSVRESTSSPVNLSREPSLKSNISERRASRRAQLAARGRDQESTDNSRHSVWQQRLAEAQMEYMDNATNLLAKRNMNFFAVSKADLGSPTPPDSDQSEEDDVRRPRRIDAAIAQAPRRPPFRKTRTLWTPNKTVPRPSTGPLWTAVAKPAKEVTVYTELPTASARPPRRQDSAPLSIQSSQLWEKPTAVTRVRPSTGLWRPPQASDQLSEPAWTPQTQAQNQKAPRPVTQRPPRRNKRVTMLPDILESPKPLPDKRGTLGIFQFPWGEKSDTATVQSRPTMYMAMPGTMTSGGPALSAALEARARQLEAAEYSSSFFDDYDEEEPQDSDDENGSEGSDDGFDENTLWEIASLLKTDGLPSKNSLFPPPINASSVVDDYMNEVPSDDDGDNSRLQSIIVGFEEQPQVLLPQSRFAVPSARPEPVAPAGSVPHHESQTLEDGGDGGLDVNTKATEMQAASVESKDILVVSTEAVTRQAAALWKSDFHQHAQKHIESHDGMWCPPLIRESNNADDDLDYRKPSNVGSKSRSVSEKPLEQLISNRLWTAPAAKKEDRYWLRAAPQPVVAKRTVSTIAASGVGGKPPTWWERMKGSMSRNAVPQPKMDIPVPVPAPKTVPSTPRPEMRKPRSIRHMTATPAEWEAALQEAITASYRDAHRKPVFNPATTHPVFAASSLAATTEWFHPAATGYTYNVANVHPVFFGSRDITCAVESVHPAMSAFASKKLHRQRSGSRLRVPSGNGLPRSPSPSERRNRRMEDLRAQTRSPVPDRVPAVPPVPSVPPVVPVLAQAAPTPVRIMSQIEALEQERMFVEDAVREHFRRQSQGLVAEPQPQEFVPEDNVVIPMFLAGEPQQPRTSQLWSKPASDVSQPEEQPQPASQMWTPRAPSTREADTTPPAVAEDREAGLMRSRSRKEQRLAEIQARLRGLEAEDAKPAEKQGLWKSGDAEERRKRDSRGAEKDWLDEGANKRASIVILRY